VKSHFSVQIWFQPSLFSDLQRKQSGLKGAAKSGKWANGYRIGATARGLVTWTME